LKTLALFIVLLFGALLIYCTLDFPSWGDPQAPASIHVSPRYIERTMEETSVPNIVTAVLADYRGYDTMFETIVIFSAGVACLFLLRVSNGLNPKLNCIGTFPAGSPFVLQKEWNPRGSPGNLRESI